MTDCLINFELIYCFFNSLFIALVSAEDIVSFVGLWGVAYGGIFLILSEICLTLYLLLRDKKSLAGYRIVPDSFPPSEYSDDIILFCPGLCPFPPSTFLRWSSNSTMTVFRSLRVRIFRTWLRLNDAVGVGLQFSKTRAFIRRRNTRELSLSLWKHTGKKYEDTARSQLPKSQEDSLTRNRICWNLHYGFQSLELLGKKRYAAFKIITHYIDACICFVLVFIINQCMFYKSLGFSNQRIHILTFPPVLQKPLVIFISHSFSFIFSLVFLLVSFCHPCHVSFISCN